MQYNGWVGRFAPDPFSTIKLGTHSMRIGIDCRLAGKEHAGLGRYTENLIKELLSHCSKADDTFVLFFTNTSQAKNILPTQILPKIKIVIAPIQHYSLKEQLLFPLYLYKERLDLLHVPHFNCSVLYVKRLVVTIHDLLWHEKRGGSVTTLHPLLYWIKYFFYHLVTTTAISRSEVVFVPSQTVAQTIVKHYPRAEKKIVITKEGAELTPPTTVPTRKKQQLLYVGSLYPHKNIQLVIDALKKLPHAQLIIVGARNIFQKKVERYVADRNLQNRVSFRGYVTDTQLRDLYLESTALVQPSLSEGFGLTGLEALSLETPVLASDIPIFHEIYDTAAIYFNPHSVDSFIQAYTKLSKQSFASFVHRARSVTSEYSWRKMAELTYAEYTKLTLK